MRVSVVVCGIEPEGFAEMKEGGRLSRGCKKELATIRPSALNAPMEMKMKVISPPDPKKTKRDGSGRLSWAPLASGDCDIVCPCCKFVKENNVSREVAAAASLFTCPACGAEYAPSGLIDAGG